jgi:hypothetical protein
VENIPPTWWQADYKGLLGGEDTKLRNRVEEAYRKQEAKSIIDLEIIDLEIERVMNSET